MAEASTSQAASLATLATGLVYSILFSPLNLFLCAICITLIYLIYRNATNDRRDSKSEPIKILPPFPKGDLTLEELRLYDGTTADGRILLSVNREIFDVTKGARFYGPEGPYSSLAGHDATRALALFTLDQVKEEWDDYSDLSVDKMNTVNEWSEQLRERYIYIGKLVRTESEKSTPVEPSDEEEDEDQELTNQNSTDVRDNLGKTKQE